MEIAIEHGLKNCARSDRILTVHIFAEEGSVVIGVKDNGVGIDHQVIEIMFTQQSNGYGIKMSAIGFNCSMRASGT